MRMWLVCALASGCYLQPTVFEGAATVPLETTPRQPVIDPPVGCITKQPGIRRVRPAKWWIAHRRVTADDVDRALHANPVSVPLMARSRRDQRLSLALFFGGMAVAVGAFAGMFAWLNADEQSRTPLLMLLPAAGGYAMGGAGVAMGIRADQERRDAIDAFNAAAAAENRCPP
jgi:hypothetical protein